ncbi:hypothetical protein [Spirosoma koreense]
MKTSLLLTVLTVWLTGACGRDDSVGPAELLYKRWHPFQSKRVGDAAWVQYDTDAYYDTEYRLDSTVVYRRDGGVITTPCCAGSRNDQATITVLKADRLELQTGNQLTQYEPAR